MVKARAFEVKGHLTKLNDQYSGVLIYGPDEGLVRERAHRISKQVVEDLSDPFNVVRPSLSQVIEEPSILLDELLSLSMVGGRRLVRLDGAEDKAYQGLEQALSGIPKDGEKNLLVVTAGNLKPSSKIRKLFEGLEIAVTIACYADSSKDVEELIIEVLGANNLKADPQAISFLLNNLGSDRLISRSELEKIVLYAGDRIDRVIKLEDVITLIGDSATLTLNDIASATTGGDLKRLDQLLERAQSQGENAIAIIRALSRRLQQFHLVKGLIEAGQPIDSAIGKLRPPLFFKEKDIFRNQLFLWSSQKLGKALLLLSDAELGCKTTGNPDTAITSRACIQIALAAKAKRR
ncbi:MAG: DNA polymerase III subunit delta [Sphingomonadales bacterium]